MTVDEAAELILQGEVVVFPTETVYGLGADACNERAVQKIFSRKDRPADNPLIVHIATRDQVNLFAEEVPPEAELLMDRCWPGPLTLIFRKRSEIPDLVTAGLPTVAIRMPDHPVALELIRKSVPLAAPSANLSGRPSPTRADHIREDFGMDIPLLDGSSPPIGLESTVLDMSIQPFRILRPGHFTASRLSMICGSDVVVADAGDSILTHSPGTRYTHYRPQATISWFDPSSVYEYRSDTLLITHSSHPDSWPHHIQIQGGYTELAHRLYDLFRTADRMGLKRIVIEHLDSDETHPIVAALRNRIERAIGL